jgi:hypothetical protein
LFGSLIVLSVPKILTLSIVVFFSSILIIIGGPEPGLPDQLPAPGNGDNDIDDNV